MKELPKDWFRDLAKGSEDLDQIRPTTKRKTLHVPGDEAEMVPPFRGVSTRLYSMREACEIMKCSITTLRKLLRERMIFPHPRGRFVYIPEEEIANYNARAQLRYQRRHA